MTSTPAPAHPHQHATMDEYDVGDDLATIDAFRRTTHQPSRNEFFSPESAVGLVACASIGTIEQDPIAELTPIPAVRLHDDNDNNHDDKDNDTNNNGKDKDSHLSCSDDPPYQRQQDVVVSTQCVLGYAQRQQPSRTSMFSTTGSERSQSNETETSKRAVSHKPPPEDSNPHFPSLDQHQHESMLSSSPSAAAQQNQSEQIDMSSSRQHAIAQMKQELGANSQAFIEKLRGAALRRKMGLARSRDSLAAKERQQREAIAASKAAKEQQQQQQQSHEVIARGMQNAAVRDSIKTTALSTRHSMPATMTTWQMFRARPLPKSSLLKNNAGMLGVPKVEKKPTTMPVSPQLGFKRRQQSTIPTRNSHKAQVISNLRRLSLVDLTQQPFRARAVPWPSAPRVRGGGAYAAAGVPRVPKRPVTQPFSPLLGHRRMRNNYRTNERIPSRGTASETVVHHMPALNDVKQKSEDTVPRQEEHHTPPGSKHCSHLHNPSHSAGSNTTASSSTLVGIEFVIGSNSSTGASGKENVYHSPLQQQQKDRIIISSKVVTKQSDVLADTIGRNSNLEQEDKVNTPPQTNRRCCPYIPHSTHRAQQRAVFDAQRIGNEQRRHEQEMAERRQRVQELMTELQLLRKRLV